MADAATLNLKVQFSDVAKAREALGRLANQGKITEQATDRLAISSTRLNKSMVRTFTTIGAGVLTVATLHRGLSSAVGTIVDFEHSMSAVAAVTKATTDEMAVMESVARDLGATTKFSAKEAAEGMRFLGMAGFDTTEIVQAMPAVLDLASAGMLDLGEAADITSNIMSGFNMDARDTSKVADLLAAASSSANTDVRQLGEAMKFVAPVANGLGISIEETTAAMGILSNAGLQSSMAGTSLRIVLSKLANTTPKAEQALAKYGLTAKDVDPALNNIQEIVQKIADAGINMTDSFEIFDVRGAPAIAALTSQLPELREMNEEMENSAGRAKDMSEIMNDNLKGDFLALKSAIDEAILSMNDDTGFGGALREVTQYWTDFIREVSGANRTFDDVAEDIAMTQQKIEKFGSRTNEVFFRFGDDLKAYKKELEAALQEGIDVDQVNRDLGWTKMRIESLQGAIESLEKDNSMVAMARKATGELDKLKEELDKTGKKLLVLGDIQSKAREKEAKEQEKAMQDFLKKEKEKQLAAEQTAIAQEATRLENLRGIEDALMSEEEKVTKHYDDMIAVVKENADKEGQIRTDLIEKIEAAKIDALNRDKIREEQQVKDRIEKLQHSLALETEMLVSFEAKKQAEINKLTKEGSKERERLEKMLARKKAELDEKELKKQKKLDQKQLKEEKKRINQFLNLRKSEKQKIIDSYHAQVIEISKMQKVSDEERAEATIALTEDTQEKIKEIEFNLQQERLDQASSFFGDLSAIAEVFGRKGAKMAKALAIAQATIDTYAAANAAYKSAAEIPYVGYLIAPVAAGAAVAAGLANVAQIKNQNYAGSFEHGGMIPAGKVGIAGEAGAELIRGPAQVSSARTTAALGETNTRPQLNVVINNNAPVEVDVQESGDGITVDIDMIEEKLANSVDSGRGDFAESINRMIKNNA